MHNALKHLFTFAFALVFMAGAAFAQNNAYVTQNGNDDVYLDQQQVFDGSEATIEQAGGANVVEGLFGAPANTFLNGVAPSPTNFTSQSSTLLVRQSGGSLLRGEQAGLAGAGARGHDIRIDQQNGARAWIFQKGADHKIRGLSGANYGLSVNSDLIVNQEGVGTAAGHILRFQQLSGGNTINLQQIGI